jgi:very-short-patch-repair endonuclease
MKVKDLTGKTVEWKIKGHVAGEGHRMSSGLAKLGREIIRSTFPTAQFKEEVPIPTGKGTLFLDFYLPLYKMAVEVHGQQHYQFSLHFHQTRANFMKYKQRDDNKAEWCSINGITLVTLPYNEEADEWRKRLHRARCGQDEPSDGGTG